MGACRRVADRWLLRDLVGGVGMVSDVPMLAQGEGSAGASLPLRNDVRLAAYQSECVWKRVYAYQRESRSRKRQSQNV